MFAQRILYKIEKSLNETIAGLKPMLQGFRICLVLMLDQKALDLPAGKPSQYSQYGQNWLGYPAGGLYTFNLGFHTRHILNL